MKHKLRCFLKTQRDKFPWFPFHVDQPILMNEPDGIVGAYVRLAVAYWCECGDLVMDDGIDMIGEPALFRLREIRAIEIVRGKRRKIKIRTLDIELERALERATKFAPDHIAEQFGITKPKRKKAKKVNATNRANTENQSNGVDIDDPETRRAFFDTAKSKFHVTPNHKSTFNNHIELKFQELRTRAQGGNINHPLAYFIKSIESMGWPSKTQ